MLLILVASFVFCNGGGVAVTATTTQKALTASANINPSLANPTTPPSNGYGYTADQNYWVAWSALGSSAKCVASDPFSCVTELYSQQIVADPQTGNNKKVSNASPESVLTAGQSPAGQFLLYLQQAPNKTFPSVAPISGWSVRPDGSAAAKKITPPITIGLTGFGNEFFPDPFSNVRGHVVGWSLNLDDKAALLWPTGPGTNNSNQNELWLTNLNGDNFGSGSNPWVKISPALALSQTKKDVVLLSNCQNRLIFSATPVSGTNLYISDWSGTPSSAVSIEGNLQNLNSSASQQRVDWSSNGNFFALLWQTQEDFGVTPAVPSRWGLFFGDASSRVLVKNGNRIGAPQNDTFNLYTTFGWTTNGQYYLFTQQDSSNNGIADLWAYDPQADVLVRLTSLAKNNRIVEVKGTNGFVVFSTSGDGDQILAQLWSWQIAGTPNPATLINISPSGVVKNAFSGAGNAIGSIHITTDNTRVVVVAYTTQNFTANLFSCSINTANSCFQMNSAHATKDGSSITESNLMISSVVIGSTDWFVFRRRIGFKGATANAQYQVQSCSSASGSQPLPNFHDTASVVAGAADTTYGSTGGPLPTTSIQLNQPKYVCSDRTLDKTRWDSCSGGCIQVFGGQAYVYSSVDTSTTDTSVNGANRLFVNTVNNGGQVAVSLSSGIALPVAEVPERVQAFVHPTQPYVVWRAATAKKNGIGTNNQHQMFFANIPTFLPRRLGPSLNGTLQDIDNSIFFTNSATQKAIFFLSENNGTDVDSVWFPRRMYFATFNPDSAILFDATPATMTVVDSAAKDPLAGVGDIEPLTNVANIKTISNGDIIYFKSRLPDNDPMKKQAVVAISPNGGVYTVAFGQDGMIANYAALETKYQAIAVANYTGDSTSFNAFVNKAWSATIAPLFVLVALFLALF